MWLSRDRDGLSTGTDRQLADCRAMGLAIDVEAVYAELVTVASLG